MVSRERKTGFLQVRETAASPFRRGISNIEVSWVRRCRRRKWAQNQNSSFDEIAIYPTKSYAEVRHYWIWTCRVNLQIYSKSTIPCNYAMTMPAQIHAWLRWFTPRSTNPHSFCKLRENGLLRKTHNVGKYGCVNSLTRRPTLIPNIMWLAIYIFFLIIKYVVNNKLKKMHSLPSLPSRSNFFYNE